MTGSTFPEEIAWPAHLSLSAASPLRISGEMIGAGAMVPTRCHSGKHSREEPYVGAAAPHP